MPRARAAKPLPTTRNLAAVRLRFECLEHRRLLSGSSASLPAGWQFWLKTGSAGQEYGGSLLSARQSANRLDSASQLAIAQPGPPPAVPLDESISPLADCPYIDNGFCLPDDADLQLLGQNFLRTPAYRFDFLDFSGAD